MNKFLKLLPILFVSYFLTSAGDFYNNIFQNSFENKQQSDYYSMIYDKFIALESVNKAVDIKKPDYELINASIFHETNRRRIKSKLKPYVYSPTLAKAAMFHTKNMVAYNFYNHIDNKNTGCKEPNNRIKKFGGKYAITGENIYRFPLYEIEQYEDYYIEGEADNLEYYKILTNGEQGDEIGIYTYLEAGRAAVTSWMFSKGHKDNLLNSNFTEIGCGSYIKLGNKTGEDMPKLYVTQNFGGIQ